ncbi:MAG TPA: hypothetical protein VFT13_07635, partial [Candidatus Krumholzibacteria bacterium]|nr:hypothetical protein [Candidatus Krumholzibacteria bacterium]
PGVGGYYDRVWRATDDDLVVEGDLDVSPSVQQAPYGDEAEAYVASAPEFRLHKGAWFTWDLRYKLLFGPEHGDRARGHKPSRREKSFRGLTSLYDRSYLLFNLRSIELIAGRDYVDWGPSQDGGLIVPGERHSIDQIGARVFFRMFRYDAFFGQLFPDPERYLIGHRLEGTFGRTVVGFSETVTYGGRGPDWLYLLPFSSYYANQYSERTNADNILWCLDAKTSLFDCLTLHSSLLIDDFQYERDDEYPDKLAYDAGFRFVPARPLGLALRGSYRRVNTYTYSHDDSLSTYVSGAGDIAGGDVLLGGPPGGDGDGWRVDADVFPRPNLRVNLAVFGGRIGERNPIRAFAPGTDDPAPPFPSGVVEKALGFEIGARWELDGNSRVSAAYSHGSADNVGNVSGNDETTDAFRVEIRWDIP